MAIPASTPGRISRFGAALLAATMAAALLPSVALAAAPTVTINQAAGQVDPTGTSPINYTVVFDQSVTGFDAADISFTGSTVGGTLAAAVTGSGTTYNVAVSGMTTGGVVVASVVAGAAVNSGAEASLASTSTDNQVTWALLVTINQASGQADPTGTSPISFTAVFSSSVTGFDASDVTISGTAGGTKVVGVSGSGTTYTVTVSGMTTSGTVIATIPAGGATDGTNTNSASTSTDNSVTWGLSVTINQASGQADPTGTSPINFTVVFSSSVTGFTSGDVTITGTAGGTKVVTVTGSGTTYNVAVTGMTSAGTVIASIPAGGATDGTNTNLASTSTDNTVTWGLSVTINQASGQADPTGTSPINFTVVFSSSVTGFTGSDVTITGTAGGTKTATVTGSGTTYNVAVTGMTSSGTVIASIPAGGATDGTNTNLASTSTDNTVTWGLTVTINQASGQADPTGTSPINFTAVFSQSVTGFNANDVTISGTAGGTKSVTVTGSGTTYTVAVTGMTTAGTVIATIAAGAATAGGGLDSLASTSTDNTVTWSGASASITLTNSASVITWGGSVALSIQFGTGGANRSFILEGARDGVNYVAITTLTTNASGQASFTYRPVSNLYYRARFTGATDLAAGNSNVTRTVVRQIALLRPTNSGAIRTVNRGTSVTFTTTVRPVRPELPKATVSFVLYKRIGGVWTLISTRNVVINSLGKASTTFRFSSAGSYYVRSIARPTPFNANSVWSRVERYNAR